VTKKQRIELREGDLFAVPLSNGTFGLGHVVHVVVRGRHQTPSVVLLSPRADAIEKLSQGPRGVPVSSIIVTGDTLEEGDCRSSGTSL
jgi:hypothetical protein